MTVSDSQGDAGVADLDQYEGDTYETIVHDGTGTDPVVTDTITDPWSSTATATHSFDESLGLPDQNAYITGDGEQRVYTPLSSGATRETETKYTHDAYGRVTQTNDYGDTGTSADDLCTTTTYADNTTANILDTPDETTTTSGVCSTDPVTVADAVSDIRTFYDNSTTFGTAPTGGNVTQVQTASSYTGSTPNYVTTSGTVDEYGRTLTSTDADNRTTKTLYTPTTGAEPTSIAVTDPKTYTTVTTYDPLRDLALQSTDPASYVSKEQYDALGRLTAVFKPGITNASLKYSYALSNSAPSIVTTQTLNNDGTTYRDSEALYDALLRARETQTAVLNGGRLISDTTYNTDGLVSKSDDPYYDGAALSSTIDEAQDGRVPSVTGYTYDGAGRQSVAIANNLGSPTWQTTTSYGGNVTTTVPPHGGTAQSVFTDARGNTTDLYQYHAGAPVDPVNDPSSDYSDTHYTYYPSGKQSGETDAAGNSWSWQYDLLGDQTSATDPDTGNTASTYDNAGQLMSVTDARGKQTSYTYDVDGRKTFAYDTTGSAAESTTDETGAWTYDTVKKGYPTASTSYQMGTSSTSVTNTVLGYSGTGAVNASKETLGNLPSDEAALEPSNGYVTSYAYKLNGLLASTQDSAVAGLPAETVNIGYDAYDEPISLGSGGTSSWTYVDALGYNQLGEPVQYTFGGSPDDVLLNLSYDPQTNALTEAKTSDPNSSSIDDTTYDYGTKNPNPPAGALSQGAGLLASTTDAQNGGATTDTQCFTYDYATRLSGAWTATDNCAATPSSGSSSTVGGPNPYWQTWTYDAAGDRSTGTDHDTTGVTANDTTTTYHYPTAGSSSDQPHALTSTSASGPNASANTATYGYDADGNTKSISGGSAGEQTMTWNDQNQLATDTSASGSTTYLYDADGNLALRTDPDQATLFVGDEQIVENTGSGALTGTRYYSIGGQQIAERSSTGDIQYLIPDRQGTDTLAVDYTSFAVTRRQYTPFGQTRGTIPSIWPGGDQGYVGGTPDTTTNLENLGVREYDPADGRFISADPILESTDPTQLGGYDYAGNDPVTGSDPTGQMYDGSGGTPNCGWGCGDGSAPPTTPPPSCGFAGCGHETFYDRGYDITYSAHSISVKAPVVEKTRNSLLSYLDDAARVTSTILNPHVMADVGETALGLAGVAVGAGTDVGGAAMCATGVLCAAGAPAIAGGTALAGLGFAETYKGVGDLFHSERVALSESDSGPCSFDSSTPVLMAGAKTKPIGKIKPGDKVEAADPTNGKFIGARRVLATWINHDHDLLDVTIAAPGHHKATIHTTANHPFWDDTTHTWVPAGALNPGDHLATTGDNRATVAAVTLRSGVANRDNLTVDQLHTYYVLAGTTPILCITPAVRLIRCLGQVGSRSRCRREPPASPSIRGRE